jgi:hypothetical protein
MRRRFNAIPEPLRAHNRGTEERNTMNKEDVILFSGGARGAEEEFGATAERHEIEEVNFTFEGHSIARGRGLRYLNHQE